MYVQVEKSVLLSFSLILPLTIFMFRWSRGGVNAFIDLQHSPSIINSDGETAFLRLGRVVAVESEAKKSRRRTICALNFKPCRLGH